MIKSDVESGTSDNDLCHHINVKIDEKLDSSQTSKHHIKYIK